MPRPICATIFPDAIAHNLSIAQTQTLGVFTWAVIKANAYGHGIERIYPGLASADGLAMLDFDEARRVRTLGWQKPILMLEGIFNAEDASLCQTLNLISVVHQCEQLEWLIAQKIPFKVYLKLNSGMNRLGFALDELPELSKRLLENPQIQIQSWMTHFANADVGTESPAQLSAAAQQQRFEAALDALCTTNEALRAPFSLSNSAAILQRPQAYAQSVRAGIMLYGASPFAHASANALGLQPTMQLRSEIIGVQRLKAGDSVGYGSTFIAPHDMLLGVVACGYADGYPRHAPSGTPIAVDGIRTRTVGRVSMDMLTVDLSGVPQARVGSVVELWGCEVLVEEVAAASGTIAYELMCALAARVPVRVFKASNSSA